MVVFCGCYSGALGVLACCLVCLFVLLLCLACMFAGVLCLLFALSFVCFRCLSWLLEFCFALFGYCC